MQEKHEDLVMSKKLDIRKGGFSAAGLWRRWNKVGRNRAKRARVFCAISGARAPFRPRTLRRYAPMGARKRAKRAFGAVIAFI